MFYILDDDNQPKPATMQECAGWMNDPRRIVKQETFWPWSVSTVFLGIDHGILSDDIGSGEPKPVLFETMVFRGNSYRGIEQQRYTSYDDALAGHQNMAAKYFMMRNLGACVIGFIAVVVVMLGVLAL